MLWREDQTRSIRLRYANKLCIFVFLMGREIGVVHRTKPQRSFFLLVPFSYTTQST